MTTENQELLLKDECYRIVGACMTVHNELGTGFLEPVYQEALALEFDLVGIPYQKEHKIDIYYRSHKLNKNYTADFVCFGSVIVELKALSDLSTEHLAQVINYLKATNLKLGLLVNFGQTSLQYKRIVL